MNIPDLSSWAEHLHDPLVLIGFVVMLFTGIAIAIIKRSNVHRRILNRVLLLSFLMGIVVIVLGFVIAFGHNPSSDTRILWEKNWNTVNESHGFLSASGPAVTGGGSWTNREKFLAVLTALDISNDLGLKQKRDQLVVLIHNGEAHPNGEPYYNLRYTQQMRSLEDAIKRGIRNRTIEQGVDISRDNP